MWPDERARSEHCKRGGAVVGKNGWWYADCPKHGKQVHMDVIGGMCVECKKEKEAEQGKSP